MSKLWIVFLAMMPIACGGGGSPSLLAEPHAASQLLVMLENPDDAGEVEELRQDFAGIAIERIGTSAFFVLSVPPGTDLDRLMKELDDDLRVVLSEPDYLASSPEGGPSDVPIFGDDLVAAIAPQPELAALQLDAAHGLSTGAGVIVAVVDTGVDFTHPYLQGVLAPGGYDFIGQDFDPAEERNFLDDDGDGLVDEQYGHGTFVASLVHTVAPDALLLPVRVLDDEGFGTASTVAAGIIWATDAGATVINVSVDMPVESGAVKDAISYALQRDVVVVAAAGNEGAPDVIFPARFSGVIAVAATDAQGVVAPFSNTGSRVSVVAPGVSVLGAVPMDLAPTGTAHWSGTSFSSPLVAGTAALVRALNPAMSESAVRQRLEDTAVDVDPANPGLQGNLGRGMVHPFLALQ